MQVNEGFEVRGVTGHAEFRYRDRLDFRCADAAQAVLADIGRGLPRPTAPRWMHVTEPGDFYVQVHADDFGPERVYVIRDGLVITVIDRPDAETRHVRGASHPHRRRRRHARA